MIEFLDDIQAEMQSDLKLNCEVIAFVKGSNRVLKHNSERRGNSSLVIDSQMSVLHDTLFSFWTDHI